MIQLAVRSIWRQTLAPSIVLLVLGGVFISQTTFRLEDGQLASHLADDAAISLRYARNLAQGQGLTWNPGAPPIEGTSTIGWVLVMAAVHWVGVPERFTPLAMACLGLIVLLLLVQVAARLAERLQPDAGASAAWLVALCYPLIYWTLRGFEVGACALILTTVALLIATPEEAPWTEGGLAAYDDAVARNQRRYLGLTALLFVGLLLRDDMLVPLAVIIAFSSRRKGLLAALAVAVMLKTAFRLAYFGDYIPLTAHLKLGGVSLWVRLARGAGVLAQALWQGLWLPVLGCVFARKASRLPLAAVLGVAAYTLSVGGDAWEDNGLANRFLAPILPLAMVGLAVAIGVDDRRLTNGKTLGILTGILGIWLPAAWFVLDFEKFQSHQPNGLALGLSLLGVLGVMLLVPVSRFAVDLGAGRIAAVAWVCLTVAITSGASWVRHLREGSSEFFGERFHAIHGMRIEQATQPGATVALIQAGNEGYYCHRALIDQLGKSDRHIALEDSIAGDWKPGHSKIDQEYSIGQLRPDVVDEVYMRTWGDYTPMKAWGYGAASLNLWVRMDSKLVDVRQILALAEWDNEQWRAAAARGERTW